MAFTASKSGQKIWTSSVILESALSVESVVIFVKQLICSNRSSIGRNFAQSVHPATNTHRRCIALRGLTVRQ
jgi:hypothetical protein